VGKPLSYARDELPVCADNLRFFAGAARILEGRSSGEYMRGYTSWIRREPIGVVGGIAPWNYPLMMAVWKLAVISKAQQDRVFGFLERAKGAKVLTGGSDSNGSRGFFVKPTVVVDVEQTDEIVQREVFGPVVTVQRFADDDQAIAWANDVPYGLAAAVLTRDIARALNAARRLQFGTVWINDHIPLVSEMPHGGFKQSGYGKDLSTYSLEDYTQIKHVMAKLD
jgi:acyl-CoA reductase-like NAD-dependent aldehyde dehydrogenase